jgi:hypothetical protein
MSYTNLVRATHSFIMIMEHVVPIALQHLRATDIIRMAGLAAASRGQEYARAGAVQQTQRQGGRIAGVVSLPQEQGSVCPVEVEVYSSNEWASQCACEQQSLSGFPLNGRDTETAAPSQLLCSHAAALLYQWLTRPMSFSTEATPLAIAPKEDENQKSYARDQERWERGTTAVNTLPSRTHAPLVVQRGPVPLSSLTDILTQLGLSELRGIAREYDISSNGMGKQQLAEAILSQLQQPEAVRHIAAQLEKPQRQLLAALALAGGSLMDEDLRGLFDRFRLGQQSQLQGILLALQGKGLLFRTSMNSSPQQRSGLNSVLLDVGWYVPLEVRNALRIQTPVTRYNLEEHANEVHTVQEGDVDSLLTTLLLVARTIEQHGLSSDDVQEERNMRTTSSHAPRSVGTPTGDSSIALPPPADQPTQAILALLQDAIPRPLPLLRFAWRLLRLSDMVYKERSQTSLHVLPHITQLLLSPSRFEVMRDLFSLWYTQSSYEELYTLRTHGLRLRIRASSLNQPLLRPGELDAENSEARQALLALLAQAPVEQWISANAFARLLYRIDPLFLQKRQRLFASPHWWIEQEAERPLHPTQLADWLKAELHYFTGLLHGPLHWWGLCDLALADDGHMLAFRLTPLAHWLLHGDTGDAPGGNALGQGPGDTNEQAGQQLDVSAHFSQRTQLTMVDAYTLSIACSPSNWSSIETLERFTEVAGVRDGRLCYRVTQKALANAISKGYSSEPLLAQLRAVEPELATQDGLMTLYTHVAQWIANYGRTRIYTSVTLLETADPVVMRELSATTSLDAQVVQTIQPTLSILNKTGAEQVTDELKRRGHMPLLHTEDMHGTH